MTISYTPNGELIREGVGRTPWAVYCAGHHLVFLSRSEYTAQMQQPNARWACPLCLDEAKWDDDTHENFMEQLQAYHDNP